MRAGDDMPAVTDGRAAASVVPVGAGSSSSSAAVALFVLITSLRGIAGFYTDYLWFDSLGQTGVWRGVLGAKIALAVVFTGLFFVLMWVNLSSPTASRRSSGPPGPRRSSSSATTSSSGAAAGCVRIGVSPLFALIAGAGRVGPVERMDAVPQPRVFGIEDRSSTRTSASTSSSCRS